MNTVTVSLDTIEQKTSTALQAHGALPWIADSVAQAVRRAEATGNIICGLYYLDSYCRQLHSGRVKGAVQPKVSQPKPATVKVDAMAGFAQPAFAQGIELATSVAHRQGICAFTICHSHTCTSMGYFTAQIAAFGMIGVGTTNAPACVSPPGGTRALLGTNPIAMSIPARNGGIAIQFDQSTSAIAIGKIRMAAAHGEKIPLGWAVDSDGQPTDDPNIALQSGSLSSSGGYKGYGFGLMAEILAAAVTGSDLSITASPVKATEGPAQDFGQFYFLIDPTSFAGETFWQRLDTISEAVAQQPGARLPGARQNWPNHVTIDAELWQQVLNLASS